MRKAPCENPSEMIKLSDGIICETVPGTSLKYQGNGGFAMKKLKVVKGAKCMACLECVRACSTSFYKEFDPDKSCIQIVDKNGDAKPMVCVQCGKCAKACPEEAITQNAKGVYMVNKKKCTGCGKCVERFIYR